MYSRQHLLSFGFKKSSLEYAAIRGFMGDAIRTYDGGPRLFTASQVIALADKLGMTLAPETELKLKEEAKNDPASIHTGQR
jgi:hypothetical protein